ILDSYTLLHYHLYTLSPYSTLFRSIQQRHPQLRLLPRHPPPRPLHPGEARAVGRERRVGEEDTALCEDPNRGCVLRGRPVRRDRSEEHTSELQSRENLVCRLLLEKK